MLKILLVEDDLTFSQLLEGFLEKHGYKVESRHTIKSGIDILKKEKFQLLLLDYRLPDGNSIDILNTVKQAGFNIPAIIMTSFNDVRIAVKAMRSGAFDYITKPVNPDELLMVIQEALGKKTQSVSLQAPSDFIRGESKEADKLYEYIELVAPTNISVIIQGESGTGKEHVANAIHHQSKRAGKPFVALDCGSLSGELAASELFGHVKGAFTGAETDKIGQFEVADGGTIFLDEVGNLSYQVQVKLLRAVQERVIQPLGSTRSIPIDVRIITATNDDLAKSVKEGLFREDLYYRLNEFKIQLPPLRSRKKDLAIFIEQFVKNANIELGRNVKVLSPEVLSVFERYDWPGNLRELKNVIRRMVLLTSGELAGIESLPEEMVISISQQPATIVTGDADLKALNEMNERALISATLIKVKYNKTLAAKLLNIDRKTLYNKIERYGLE